MSDPADINDRLEAAAEKAENGSQIIHDFANGDENTEVPTESGSIPTLAKLVKDTGISKALPDYVAVRSYTGPATSFQITSPGISGRFSVDDSDTTSADDNGTILLDGTGRRVKRVYTGATDVLWFKPSGVSDTAAFQAAYDASFAGAEIKVSGPGPYAVGTVTGSKSVTWNVCYDINTNLALLSLPGRVVGGFASSGIVRRNHSLGTEFATIRIDRVADYSGGSSAQVCSNLRVTTDVTNNAAASYEWGITSVMNNSGRGENVSVYGQANRRAGSDVTVGGTFGAVFEARDYTGEVNPSSGLITSEYDMIANGPDANGRRVVQDIVIGKQDQAGATCEAFAAFRVSPQGNILTAGRFRYGFHMVCDKDYGIYLAGPTVENVIDLAPTSSKIGIKVGGVSSQAGFVHDGSAPYGMRFSGVYANAAIRIPEGVGIAYENTGVIQMMYNAGFMELRNAGTPMTSFSTANGSIKVGTNQVVGPRKTGWAADTGTAKRTSSATFLQTAPAAYSQSSQQAVNDALAAVTQAMKALKDDLLPTSGHGLIGA